MAARGRTRLLAMSGGAALLLRVYGGALSVLARVVALAPLLLGRQHQHQRLPLARPAGPLLWVRAASVGPYAHHHHHPHTHTHMCACLASATPTATAAPTH